MKINSIFKGIGALLCIVLCLACNKYADFNYFDDNAVITDIELNGASSLTLDAGSAYQLNYWPIPANANPTKLTFTTDNPKVATVSQTGTITAVDGGNATITVAGDNASKTVSVKVNALDFAKDIAGEYSGDGELKAAALGIPELPLPGQTIGLVYASIGQLSLAAAIPIPGLGDILLTGTISVSKEGSEYTLTGTGKTNELPLYGVLPIEIAGKVAADGVLALQVNVMSGAAVYDFLGAQSSSE
ncbi:MAG: Ig-like domain-containing protein [Tannerellaceae bacterium]|jgi:hypothetical protein|nr:Ig-like domain-containing protein [Tannerellaceae bacterium]